MGCDIHLYVEEKVGNIWKCIGTSNYSVCKKIPTLTTPSDRNYGLFNILAGVRGEDESPLHPEKDLIPNDLSNHVRKEWDGWECDAHSLRVYSLSELISFNWNGPINRNGYVPSDEYDKWKNERTECPEFYCGDVGGGHTKKISEYDYLSSKEKALLDSKLGYYVYCEWKVSYKYYAKEFIEYIQELQSKQKGDIRLIMWFDN